MTLDIETIRDDLPPDVVVTLAHPQVLLERVWNIRHDKTPDCDQWQVALYEHEEPDAALARVWDTHESAIYRAQRNAAKAARDAEMRSRDEAYKRDIYEKRLAMQSRKEAKRQQMKDKHGKKSAALDDLGSPAQSSSIRAMGIYGEDDNGTLA